MKMRPLPLLTLVLTISVASTAAAQAPAESPPPISVTTPPAVPERTAQNSVYVELLGNGLLYSLNYDRMLNENFSVRVGLMYFSVKAQAEADTASANVMLFPILANYLIGPGNHKLEIGAGPLILYASAKADIGGDSASASGVALAGTAVFGYRYVPKDGGFTFRAGFTPVFSQNGFAPWLGLSFGYVF
jgi:hypothetical protein